MFSIILKADDKQQKKKKHLSAPDDNFVGEYSLN